MKLYTVLGCCLLALSASAKIGENAEQIRVRYGEPTSAIRLTDSASGLSFDYRGYEVMVVFINGISESEQLSRKDDREISDSVALSLADAVTGPRLWTKEKAPSLRDSAWQSKDKAFWVHKENRFMKGTLVRIVSTKALNYFYRAEKSKDAQDVAAFASPAFVPTNTPIVLSNVAPSEAKPSVQDIQQKMADEKAAKQKESVLKHHQELADKGDPYGLFKMGERYLNGDGVEKDLVKAKVFLTKAAMAGHDGAKDLLSKFPTAAQ